MKLFRTLILTLSAYALISCGGAEERKSVYMEKAKSSIETGNFEKARIELKNVLQIDPKDSEAYYLIGKVFEQSKNYGKAFANYRKAEDLNPDLLENKARLGRLYLLLADDLEKTQEIIDFILAKEPANSEGLLLKAAVYLKDNKKQEAINIGIDILKINPGNIDAASFVVTMYLRDKKFDEATDVLNTAVQANQGNDPLNNLLAIALVANKDYERAEVIFKNFLEKYPDDRSSYDRLASLYNTTGDEVKAEVVLRQSIENNPQDTERYLTLVKYIQQIKGSDESIHEMKVSAAENRTNAKLRIALAELYNLNGDKQLAIEVYEEAIKDFSEELTGIESRIALASIYFNDRDMKKADEMVESAIAISPNDPKINFLRAKLAVQNNDNERAIISLRIVLKQVPENINAYLLLASIYQMENNDEQVNATLSSAHANNKNNPKPLLLLARYYMSRDLDKTERIIEDLTKVDEFNYEGMSIKTVILNQHKKQDEAYELAKKIIDLYPERPNGYLQTIPYLGKQKNTTEAISTLEKGYLIVKDNRKLLSLLTNLQISEKQYEIAEKRILTELNLSPEDSELNLLLSKIYLLTDKANEAEKILKEVIRNQPEIEEPYLWLSQLYTLKKDMESLKSILEQGTENVVTSYKLPLKLASMYEQDNDFNKATDVYRVMYKTYPDNLVVLNNLASMLSDYSTNADDLELAKSLVDKLEKSGQPVFLDTIGWVYYKVGDYPKAIEYLLKVVEKAPDVNIFNYHLGMAYKAKDDHVNAKVYLEKSLANGKTFKGKDKAQKTLSEL